MDILAISKDRSRLLVVELKRGRASDAVVGQTQCYMGFVQHALLEPGQTVEGVIIAQQDYLRIRRALSMARSIRFMTYRVEFRLEPLERRRQRSAMFCALFSAMCCAMYSASRPTPATMDEPCPVSHGNPTAYKPGCSVTPRWCRG